MQIKKSWRKKLAQVTGLQSKIDSLGVRLQMAQEARAKLLPMAAWVRILRQLNPGLAHRGLQHIEGARSQLGQDLFALLASDFKSGGFFIEIGATNGIKLSNTWILESHFNWRGILVEPARVWHSALSQNRKSAIETRAVWRESGEQLDFIEASVLSTVKGMESQDDHGRSGKEYKVDSLSPRDLLMIHKAPPTIDFLSIDTEGSDLTILTAFPFDEYLVDCICVEHNYSENESKIETLLEERGFTRVLKELSSIDAWFVRTDSKAGLFLADFNLG